MTTVEVLKAARSLLSEPDRWTQGTYARDADGKAVPPSDPAAVCFCIHGAILHVAPSYPDMQTRLEAVKALADSLWVSLVMFNDKRGRTQREVVALFDVAIAGLWDA